MSNEQMTSDEIRTSVQESLKSMGVEMQVTNAGERNRDGWKCDAWHIVFAHKMVRGKDQSFDYYTGLGHRKVPKSVRRPYYVTGDRAIAQWVEQNARPVAPDAANVLQSLVLDASANDQSFNDWCDDCGYDVDSRKALDTYQACCDNAKKLFTLFSRAEVDALRKLLQDY